MEIDDTELEKLHGDNDIRNHNINPAEPYDRTFYGIDQHNGMTLLHQFRTIIDHVNRPGFYAVSLVMPSGKGLADGKSVQLLNRLSDHYHQLYVQGGTVANQIRIGVTEDATAFGDILRSPEFKLDTIAVDAARNVTPKQAFTYSSSVELSAIFDQQGREEIRSVKKLFLFSDSMRSICPREIPLGLLPPPPVRYDLELQVSGADGTSFQQVSVTATRNGASAPISGKPGGRVAISGLREKDEVHIRISQHGYADRNISPAEVRQWLAAQSGNNTQPVLKPISLSKASTPSYTGSSTLSGGRGGAHTGGSDFEERVSQRKKKVPVNKKQTFIALVTFVSLVVIVVLISNWPGNEVNTNSTSDGEKTRGVTKPVEGGGVEGVNPAGRENPPQPEQKVDSLSVRLDSIKTLVGEYLALTEHNISTYMAAATPITNLKKIAEQIGNTQIKQACINLEGDLIAYKTTLSTQARKGGSTRSPTPRTGNPAPRQSNPSSKKDPNEEGY